MTPDKIKIIASSALNNIEAVLRYWLPGGKREGREYLPLNPKRADGSPGSFSINLHCGSWSDFATGDKGGDLVALVAYLENIPQGDAASRLAKFLGISLEKSDASERAASDLKGQSNAKTLPDSNNAINGSSEKNNGWQCVMPVPNDAPKPPTAHSRNGEPSQRYPYCDLNGRVIFYHDRYEPRQPEERKQFSPLTLWQKGKIFKWQFKAPPKPRPLYGLPGLLKYPNATVWLVEGEKAAIALEKLLPDHPVLTWQGGSQAVSKSDYTPLTGRHVVVWPDHDAAGTKAATVLVKQLRAIKVASVNVLNVSRLVRKDNKPLQPGDDVHDLLIAGWTAEQFAALLTQNDVLLSVDTFAGERDQNGKNNTVHSKPESETSQRGFEVFESGVYFIEPTNGGNLYRRWICSKLEVLALVRTQDNKEWGKLVSFEDYDRKVKRLIVPMKNFNGEGLAATGELLAEGLNIAPKARQLVLEYLQTSDVDSRARLTEQVGWHNNNNIFVMPKISIGESKEEWLYTVSEDNPFRQRGTLEQWKEKVARLCAGNSRLILAVSAAFGAPLLRLVNGESGGFHYRGGSSSGKSTGLYAATSVVGAPEYFLSWRATDTSIENLAQARNDCTLILDDLKQVDARLVDEIALMIGNGMGKSRGKAEGGNRKTARWSTILLSTGELSLAQHAASVGNRIHAGSEVRINDIPADCGLGMLGFECIHGYESPDAFAKAVHRNTEKFYGVAFVTFIRNVIENMSKVASVVHECHEVFSNTILTSAASSQVRRVSYRFSLVAAAGELATHWGVTGWQPGESMQAAVTCFNAWLEGWGGEGNREEKEMLANVRHFLESHGEGRFVLFSRAEDTHAPKTLQCCGYRKTGDDGTTEYFVFPESFKKEVCRGYDYRAVAKLLIEKAYMKPGDGKNLCPKVDLPGKGRVRAFHILPSIWSDDDG